MIKLPKLKPGQYSVTSKGRTRVYNIPNYKCGVRNYLRKGK